MTVTGLGSSSLKAMNADAALSSGGLQLGTRRPPHALAPAVCLGLLAEEVSWEQSWQAQSRWQDARVQAAFPYCRLSFSPDNCHCKAARLTCFDKISYTQALPHTLPARASAGCQLPDISPHPHP